MKSGWIEMGVLLVFGIPFAPLATQADIVERKFVQKESGKSASGYIFQGSRNMRDLKSGKRRPVSGLVVAPFSVPSLSPSGQVQTTPQNQPQRKPRFGYGAEERKEVKGEAAAEPTPARQIVSPEPSPVYQFRYTYPVYRDYFFGNPFLYSPGCYGGRHSHFHGGRYTRFSHGGYGVYRGSRFSLFFGW